MDNKLFCYFVGAIFILIAVGLTSIALAHFVLNPFLSVISSGFAIVTGISGADFIKLARRL